MDATGATKPTGGTLAIFEPPSGPGVRVDTFGYAGYKTSAAFDSLLAKVIVHSPSSKWTDAVAKGTRTLREFRIGGVATNIPLMRAILANADFRPTGSAPASSIATSPIWSAATRTASKPLFAASGSTADARTLRPASYSPRRKDRSPVPAPLQGTVVAIAGGRRRSRPPRPADSPCIESMKMEHLVTAPHGGGGDEDRGIGSGVTLMQGEAILYLEPAEIDAARRRPRKRMSISTTSARISPN